VPGERAAPLPLPEPGAASGGAWQRLYGAAHRLRARYWARRAERLPAPVWSVGNLHWGGTGKTPLVAAIAAWLRDRGVRVGILSRGYGRDGREPLVVSRGAGPLVPPERAGDEAWLLASELPGVAVAVARRRADAGRLLLATAQGVEAPQLFLLDDGFSHLRLARDLDLLVLPAEDPLGGRRLPPGGRLREPLAAAGRADAVLLSGSVATPASARDAGASLAAHGFAGPCFSVVARCAAPVLLAGQAPEAGAPLLLVTGVARPERIRRAAEAAGVRLAGHLVLRDHHRYSERTLRRIAELRARSGAAGVLVTAKDRGKLLGRVEAPLLELPLRLEPEPALWTWLGERLAAARSDAGAGAGATGRGAPSAPAL
jgi:tetraacyldisaccharide 4'-kinase